MWKYLGNGFLTGIPARDLTDEEAELLARQFIKDLGFGIFNMLENNKNLAEILAASGLYEHIGETKPLRDIKITTRQQRETQPPQGEEEKE